MIAVILQGCHGCGPHLKQVADSSANNDSGRINMKFFNLASPGIVTIYDAGPLGGVETFTIDLMGAKHALHTSQFYQGGIERYDLQSSQGPVSWGVPVPEDALVFGATSGVMSGFSHQFWVGWLVGRRLHMQALMQVKPIDMELATDEVPIFPAVTDLSGVGNLYTWRPTSHGTVLWRHSFTGQIKTVGTVTSEALSEIPGHPVVSVAGTIPGEQEQHAVIGWVEATPDGAVMGMAIVKPDRLRVIRSKPMAGMAPFLRQRIGVWAAASPGPVGHFQLVAALQSQTDRPAYSVAALKVSADSDLGAVDLSDSGIPAGTLHSAAFDEDKQHTKPSFSRTFLTKDGTVLACNPPEVRLHGVDLESPLPVADTSFHTYWGTRKADGTMTFEWF